MNRIPCEVIQDLLPSYVDELCSEKSAELVEEHLESCEDCAAIYRIQKEDNDFHSEIEEKEIDFLKKNRRKTRKKTVLSCLAVLVVLLLIFFLRFFVIGGKEAGSAVRAEVFVNEDKRLLALNLSSYSPGYEISGVTIQEEDGIISFTAKGVFASFLYGDTYVYSYRAEDEIQQIRVNGTVIWDQGEDISPFTASIYETRHIYVGDMSANAASANALKLSTVFGAYSNELLTTEQPYTWILTLLEGIPEDEEPQKKAEMQAYAYALLAIIDNMDQICYRYQTAGRDMELSFTSEEASAFFGQDIKACGSSPILLKKLLQMCGLEASVYVSEKYFQEELRFSLQVIDESGESLQRISLQVYKDGEIQAAKRSLDLKDGIYFIDQLPQNASEWLYEGSEILLKFTFVTDQEDSQSLNLSLLLEDIQKPILLRLTGDAKEGYRLLP